MDPFLYRGARASQISFPLGGIGAGCIGLAGNVCQVSRSHARVP